MDNDTKDLFIAQFNRGLDTILIFSTAYFLLHWMWLLSGVIIGFSLSFICFVFYLYNRHLYR